MNTLKINTEKSYGKFKLLNATNGGPWCSRHHSDQYRSNFEDYKAARIPFARNHDSAMCGVYGGPYSHDITCIFPNFDADVNDPASYDFACTDEAILVALEAGTKTFFRLGQTIEHQIKKHGTIPPRDYRKWAEICEHIIRHYTEGWAEGFYHDMPYWEIWNEPDLDDDDSSNKRCWGGTKAQFFEFYKTAAVHLKNCFPHLKIGGPAIAGRRDWAEDFLRYVRDNNIPLDFFSWHIYSTKPDEIYNRSVDYKNLLLKYGFDKTESILNEWNYVETWGREYVNSLMAIHGMKGAAFTMACVSLAQMSDIDMLMYYDWRPSVFCGAFDLYSYEKLKGYYPLYWYGMFYDMECEIRAENRLDDIYSLSGKNADGKILSVITYYTNEKNMTDKEIKIDFGREGKYEVFRLDEEHNGEKAGETGETVFTLRPNSCIMLREI